MVSLKADALKKALKDASSALGTRIKTDKEMAYYRISSRAPTRLLLDLSYCMLGGELV